MTQNVVFSWKKLGFSMSLLVGHCYEGAEVFGILLGMFTSLCNELMGSRFRHT